MVWRSTMESLFALIIGAIERSLLTSWCTRRNFNGSVEFSLFSRLTFSNAPPSVIQMRLWNWKQYRPRREFVQPDQYFLDSRHAYQLKSPSCALCLSVTSLLSSQ